jgi:Uma2 family endonuclease
MTEPAYRLDLPETENWPRQGDWTYEDYLRLPDDGNRYEVIRGSLYVTPAPVYDHQFSVVKLSRFFDVFVSDHGLGVVLSAPFDIKLPFGIASPVQPDLMVFLTNAPRSGDKNFEGVPDLVVEVLSPSTRHRDRRIKRDAYRDAGIPEYWMVDPGTRTALIYRLDKGRYVETCHSVVGERVGSAVLPGFELAVADLFPR